MWSEFLGEKIIVLRDTQCCETDFLGHYFLLVFEIWSILYSTFVVSWGLERIQKKNYIKGANTKSTISQKLKKNNELKNAFQNIAYHLG